MYPYNHKRGQTIQTDAKSAAVDRAFLAHFNIPGAKAVAALTSGVHASLNGAAHLNTTTGITNPAVPRNITATAGGTAGDIKAIQVVITGTNYNDEEITETLPAFTENTAGTVVGTKAFKTVTKIDVPAHDGTGATTVIGWGDLFGIPYKIDIPDLIIKKYFNKATDAGTLANSATALESNTYDPAGTPDGAKDIDLYLIV